MRREALPWLSSQREPRGRDGQINNCRMKLLIISGNEELVTTATKTTMTMTCFVVNMRIKGGSCGFVVFLFTRKDVGSSSSGGKMDGCSFVSLWLSALSMKTSGHITTASRAAKVASDVVCTSLSKTNACTA